MQGTPFGRYRLIGLLGRGGMGEVWRAYDTAIDRVVALKVLPRQFADDEAFRERFRREARAAAVLDEPHIVPIFDSGVIESQLYVTMRLIDGRSLDELMADGPLPPTRAVAIIEQIAAALHAAHKIGLVHRDVKPSNILIAENDYAYLIDFGIARRLDEAGLTNTGAVIGTWAYMAPERLQSGILDHRADIYALTCVLYEAVTGRRPYPGDSLERQIAGHLASQPPRPTDVFPHLPPALDDVIAIGLAKQPDQRYPTAKELAQAARSALTASVLKPRSQPGSSASPQGSPSQQGQPPHQPGVSRSLSQRKNLLIAAAVLFTVIVVTAATAALTIGSTGGGQQTKRSYGSQSTLPFAGITNPLGVAVNGAGDVYVADGKNKRVLKLVAGAHTQTEVSFPEPIDPVGVAVDRSDNVYVTDSKGGRVLKVAAGSNVVTTVPFGGLIKPFAVAVDRSGNLYVTEFKSQRVVKLAAGFNTPINLPFTGLSGTSGVAVDEGGNVYVSDTDNNRVVMLASGATTQSVLAFSDLANPTWVAVDDAGDVYVSDTDNNRVVVLAPGASAERDVPFNGLAGPFGIAIGKAGAVYVSNKLDDRVLTLPVAVPHK